MNKRGFGFLWFAINTENTNYAKLSIKLAGSIKALGMLGETAVACDSETRKLLCNNKDIDHLIQIPDFISSDGAQNFLNEWQAFRLTPFTHTIKLESDMLFTSNISWWWHVLKQHDMVFSHDCFDIAENKVVDQKHRRIFIQNHLPNIYNGLTYFRYCEYANSFFNLCKALTENWKSVREHILINCHDTNPSTDIIYALAKKILDPLQIKTIRYDFFRMIHFKPHISRDSHHAIMEKYMPLLDNKKIILGGQALTKPFHYHDKDFFDKVNYVQ